MGSGSHFTPIESCSPSKQNYKHVDVEDLKWQTVGRGKSADESKHAITLLNPSHLLKKGIDTTVETQTLYFADLISGNCGFVQLLYSNVLDNLYKSVQLNLKLFSCQNEGKKSDLWETFKIEHISRFTEYCVESENFLYELTPADSNNEGFGKLVLASKNLKSHSGKSFDIALNASFKSGFKAHPDGSSIYTDKHNKSRKIMRHVFVPKSTFSGSFKTEQGSPPAQCEFDAVPGLFIEAVQGLSPNKAASRWNFACFLSRELGFVGMEFTTTADYGKTTVTVTGLGSNEGVSAVYASSDPDPESHFAHLSTIKDNDSNWDYPSAIKIPVEDSFHYLELDSLRLVNRYDILSELPGVVRKIVQSIAGIKPYLYQYCQRASFRGQEGVAIVESTFITTHD
ncbi:LAQU0S24e00870g1_1 [Lachancea quebecensis]|uniref:LAQU0S24e00870g1_1 n=1 Tax=Lachancea quebecensis TaxID=1654605 RepID=A0A0P1L4Z2_9SACH|nr:LAQU0S24e00870g1_1 [Lachancea quebecensis]